MIKSFFSFFFFGRICHEACAWRIKESQIKVSNSACAPEWKQPHAIYVWKQCEAILYELRLVLAFRQRPHDAMKRIFFILNIYASVVVARRTTTMAVSEHPCTFSRNFVHVLGLLQMPAGALSIDAYSPGGAWSSRVFSGADFSTLIFIAIIFESANTVRSLAFAICVRHTPPVCFLATKSLAFPRNACFFVVAFAWGPFAVPYNIHKFLVQLGLAGCFAFEISAWCDVQFHLGGLPGSF